MLTGRQRYEQSVKTYDEAEAALKAHQRINSGANVADPARDAALMAAMHRLDAAQEELLRAYDNWRNEED